MIRGVSCLFLKKKEWKRIGKPKLTDVDYSFITVSGRILDVKGMYMANVFFEGQEYQVSTTGICCERPPKQHSW